MVHFLEGLLGTVRISQHRSWPVVFFLDCREMLSSPGQARTTRGAARLKLEIKNQNFYALRVSNYGLLS